MTSKSSFMRPLSTGKLVKKWGSTLIKTTNTYRIGLEALNDILSEDWQKQDEHTDLVHQKPLSHLTDTFEVVGDGL